MPAHHAFVALVLMWLAMMTAMMAPVAWPWVRAYARIDARPAAVAGFGSGYLAAWLGYSVGAALVQLALARAGAAIVGMAGGALLVVAGLYQLASLKRACLTHCRSPLTYFLARWRSGPAGGFRLGIAHGLFCVGCCWALMLTALAVGVMNLWWMAALAAVAFVEQVVPRGDRLRVPLGVALVSAGLLALIA